MERKTYGINHLESEVLLPPRKRLLAGFKKLNAEANRSACNPSKPVISSTPSDLNNLNLTIEEVAEASRSAAAASRAAKAARTAADEKAMAAAEAVAAARRALDLVAAFSDKDAAAREICLKKNHKLKKRVPLKILYTKEAQRENYRADLGLADRLDRAINSSSRIFELCSGSPTKRPKLYNNHKGLDTSDNSRLSIGHENASEGSSGSSQADEYIIRDEINAPRRITRRVRVKMLPLSNGEEDTAITKSLQRPTTNISEKPLYGSAGSCKDDPAETWICQGIAGTERIKQAVGS